MKPTLGVIGVQPLPDGILRVVWDDGVSRDVDLRPQMKGHVLLEMLTLPEVFRDVSVVPGGGGVEWVNGADFSARSLRIWSDEQEHVNSRKSA
jgi:Protein of unknown function (DUF2442)